MAHATYPSVYYDEENNEYVCLMKDKKTGQTWGTGYGQTRQDAIASARITQPSDSRIKRLIGWTFKHPILMGGMTGVALAFRDARHNGYHDWKRYTKLALIGAGVGLAVWAVAKIARGFFKAKARARYFNA